MFIEIGSDPDDLQAELRSQFQKLSIPTLGHYLEEGFVDPAIRRLTGTSRVLGPALTVRITATDSTLLHHAAGIIRSGQVLVIDTGGDTIHAPLGDVVATQLQVREAAGAVIDGVMTDIEEIEKIGLPVYARGTSALTTKLHGIDAGGINVPVSCGGVVVNPGDIVLGDANGVLVAPRDAISRIVETALEDDAEEIDLVADLHAGKRLGDLTGATEMVQRLLAETTPA